jgi:uncharacterized protein YegJ (DUF2314 family)
MGKHWILGAAMALVLTVPLAHAQKSISDRAENDEITIMASEDPAMQKAFAKAQTTLPDFLRQASNPKAGTSSYALKVGLSDGRNTEYFWVGDFQRKGDDFSATITNMPRIVQKYRQGEQINFKRAQVVDWMYIDQGNRKMVGNFTACALLTKESTSDAVAFKKQYGLSCDD